MQEDMHEAQKRKIQEIMDGMHCPRDFDCTKSNFETVCKAKDLGLGLTDYVKCFGEAHHNCTFALPFGEGHLCRCPLRVYVARALKI